MDSEARSQVLQLQEMLHAPDQSLANIVRRAVVVASMLGKHEYRILFEKHLAGHITSAPNRAGSTRLPGGYRPEIDPNETFCHDRARRDSDGNAFSAALDEIEAVYNRGRDALSSGNAMAAGGALEVLPDLTLVMINIRNRVNSFVAGALSTMSTVQGATDVLDAIRRALRPHFVDPPEQERRVQDAVEHVLRALGVKFHREKERAPVGDVAYTPDFTLPDLNLALEVKHARPNHGEKEITRELSDDITGYGTKWRHIIFVVYDNGVLVDPARLERVFTQHLGVTVLVVKH